MKTNKTVTTITATTYLEGDAGGEEQNKQGAVRKTHQQLHYLQCARSGVKGRAWCCLGESGNDSPK